jgi:hypothetical protein
MFFLGSVGDQDEVESDLEYGEDVKGKLQNEEN